MFHNNLKRKMYIQVSSQLMLILKRYQLAYINLFLNILRFKTLWPVGLLHVFMFEGFRFTLTLCNYLKWTEYVCMCVCVCVHSQTSSLWSPKKGMENIKNLMSVLKSSEFGVHAQYCKLTHQNGHRMTISKLSLFLS